MSLFSRTARILRRDGIRWAVKRRITRILTKPFCIQRAKNKVWQALLKKHNYIVAYGPFEGMQLGKDVWWSKNDRITQILGVYEQHVMEKLIEYGKRQSHPFIDIGAADGYFAVGMAFSKSVNKVYAFEISSVGQEKIKENAARNSCSDLVFVRGEPNYESLNSIISESSGAVVLLDIEGDEFQFLTEEILTLMRNCYVVCELHPWIVKAGYEKQKQLISKAENIFNVSMIQREAYGPNQFEELSEFSDEERLIALGEGREKNMKWLVLEPKL